MTRRGQKKTGERSQGVYTLLPVRKLVIERDYVKREVDKVLNEAGMASVVFPSKERKRGGEKTMSTLGELLEVVNGKMLKGPDLPKGKRESF